ncbi:tRNA (adenosine(37)-N6)-threonylcarbamoyltransferase complex dimerization subunit type 1 TsaB [Thalassomonas haliotis]|uniref:tRNA threonylcarbamoyladenosine biosynthesis protein TsaB n=1 Tax=Thalassomonas haliotis TaxID=485448 RepID=A0ABY7VIT3_9GAMM|nr:tRNA (adenosine(37)-N6)-threonylcarbamoyltransferase complex dimerization subunit type 1 TsaB [Thalassomonas haliotis]WDE13655.1 tRNA (adenosine(37)-N6)-threonylcarbamoyltransferase complex dimerization subunit type 1 TsaB [Thalassomonas haliotis]
MNFLAIDASTEACSVALQFNDEIVSRYQLCPQSHSLELLPMVDQVLSEGGCKLKDLDGLIFGQGPGSFTGVRIGIGVAQGLAYSAGLPLVGVSTLQAMAQLAYMSHQQEQVIAAIDARMSEVYLGYYEIGSDGIMQAKLSDAVLPPQRVAAHLDGLSKGAYGVGTGWDAYGEKLAELKTNAGSPEVLFPAAHAMLVIGAAAFARGEQVSAEQAQPVYVRDTVSWKKLPGKE